MIPAPLALALARASDRLGIFSGRVDYVPEAGSTNDVAQRRAAEGAPEGTTVCAGRQTAGRGRLGRTWFSPPDAGLYVSFVLRPPQWPVVRGATGGPGPSDAVSLVTITAGVAVAEALRVVTPMPVEIKWPNDLVLVDESRRPRLVRKLGGILAEATSDERGVQQVIVGIGLNVARGRYPPELRDRATSIEEQTGVVPDRWALLVELLAALAIRLEDLSSGRFAAILSAWRHASPMSVTSRVAWTAPDGRREGRACGIDHDGALLVATPEGTARVLAGELEWDLG